jgi:hypothetical protein
VARSACSAATSFVKASSRAASGEGSGAGAVEDEAAPVTDEAGTAGRLEGLAEEATDEGGSKTRPLLVESVMSTVAEGPAGSGQGDAPCAARRLKASMIDSPTKPRAEPGLAINSAGAAASSHAEGE